MLLTGGADADFDVFVEGGEEFHQVAVGKWETIADKSLRVGSRGYDVSCPYTEKRQE